MILSAISIVAGMLMTEAQVNSSHKFSITSRFDASLSADFQWDGLDSDLYDNARSSVFATVSAAFHQDRLKADITLEYAGTFDRGGQNRNILSPSAAVGNSSLS